MALSNEEVELLAKERGQTREELARTLRASRPTKEFCISDLRVDHTGVDQMLRVMQCEINGKLAELLSEVGEGERVKSVGVFWHNAPDRIKNPDGTVGNWVVVVNKIKPE